MSIKKSYIEVIEFLQANENKKVSSIMEQVLLMAESKKQSTTSLFNDADEVVAIFCYYHKQWEIVKDVAYGSKKNTNTKLNTMCKVGVSKWTKAQRDFKVGEANLLESVANGDIQPSDIKHHKEDLEVMRHTIDETDKPEGFADEETVRSYLANSGVTLK